MIKSILIAGEASYSQKGQSLAGLKALTFIYGANGTGKTTISRVVANPDNYTNCSLAWRNNAPLQCLVYNRDFIEQNFAEQMQGVFTLGEEDVSTMEAIKGLESEIDELAIAIDSRKESLCGDDGKSGKRGEKLRAVEQLATSCWEYQTKYAEDFEPAFSGHRGSKKAFRDRIMQEHGKDHDHDPEDMLDLKNAARTVFDEGLVSLSKLETPDFSQFAPLETAAILYKKVVGKDDIDIAALIKKLNNSDWVQEGMQYLDETGDKCPFCQQSIDASLKDELDAYFDETYTNDLAEIERVKASYETARNVALAALNAILGSASQHLDQDKFAAQVSKFTERTQSNLARLASKRTEASREVELEVTTAISDEISTLLAAANVKIDAHNGVVANQAQESTKVKAKIWHAVAAEAKPLLETYEQSVADLDKAIDGLSAGIAAKEQKLAQKQSDLRTLEKKITSVQPTVDEINHLLESFGFKNFSLRTTGEENELYEIIRTDGASATATLSEGEKNFITFLYFYYLVRGSTEESGVVQNRIVVIDDPVSSLDSDVLFVVSNLIKALLNEASAEEGAVKQVILLTHNIYFHKAVSYDPKRRAGCRAFETFWIVRKSDDETTLEQYDHNPIKTSYELLWDEVRGPKRSNLTIRNTLRRILENYFKILGNENFDAIVEKFEGKDKQVCASLFSWVHDGSHSAFDDDLYLSADQSLINRYLRVFEEVFKKEDQKSHYDMMMRTDETPSKLGSAESEASAIA